MGLCLPVVSLITCSVGYSRLVADGTTSWDTAAGLVVRHSPLGFLRWTGYWMVSLAVAVTTFISTSGVSMADARSQRLMQALASLGQICVRVGNLKRAEEALNRALDVRSPLQFMRETTGAVFDTLAQIHLIRGEHEQASRSLQKAR